jgi:hypothetical protein
MGRETVRSEEAGTRETTVEVEETPPLSLFGGVSTEVADKLKSPCNRSAHLVEKQTDGLGEEVERNREIEERLELELELELELKVERRRGCEGFGKRQSSCIASMGFSLGLGLETSFSSESRKGTSPVSTGDGAVSPVIIFTARSFKNVKIVTLSRNNNEIL